MILSMFIIALSFKFRYLASNHSSFVGKSNCANFRRKMPVERGHNLDAQNDNWFWVTVNFEMKRNSLLSERSITAKKRVFMIQHMRIDNLNTTWLFLFNIFRQKYFSRLQRITWIQTSYSLLQKMFKKRLFGRSLNINCVNSFILSKVPKQ